MYYVYVVECRDKSLYTGITTDLKRRVVEHNSSDLGAKYTKSRRPVRLVYSKKYRNRSTATRSEMGIKGLSRKDKLHLIKG